MQFWRRVGCGRHLTPPWVQDREDPKGTASGGGIAARPKALLQEAREAAAAARRSNNTRLFVDNVSSRSGAPLHE